MPTDEGAIDSCRQPFRSPARRAPTGLHYGYSIPKDEWGLKRRGARVIELAEASIVIRIFEMFVSGMSPHAIARLLNAERIPAKNGRAWTDSMVRGHPQRGSGILRNEIYIGRQTWNRQRFIRHPKTGREIARLNPESEWRVSEFPDLRIVPQDLWERAQFRLSQMSESPAAKRARKHKIWIKRPPKHLLDGLITCGECGAELVLTRGDRVSCAAGRSKVPCRKPTAVPRALLQQTIIDALANRLLAGSVMRTFRDFQTKGKTQRERQKRARSALRREYATIDRHLQNLIEAVAAGVRAPEVRQRLDDLSLRKAEVQSKLRELETTLRTPEPDGDRGYPDKIMKLASALGAEAKTDDAMQSIRDVTEKIVVRYKSDRIELELFGPIADVLEASQERDGIFANPRKVGSIKLTTGRWFASSTDG